jgi:hypothetical protein
MPSNAGRQLCEPPLVIQFVFVFCFFIFVKPLFRSRLTTKKIFKKIIYIFLNSYAKNKFAYRRCVKGGMKADEFPKIELSSMINLIEKGIVFDLTVSPTKSE